MREAFSIEELRYLTLEKIERLQNVKFRAGAKNLLPETKFYAGLFKKYRVDPHNLKTVDDWQKQGLPLVNKFYYMKHLEDFIVRPKNPFSTHLEYLRELSFSDAMDFTTNVVSRQALAKKLKYFYHPKMPLFSGGTQSGKPTPTFVTSTQLHNLRNTMAKAIQIMSPEYLKDTVGINLFPYGPHLAWYSVQIAFDIGADLNLATAAGNAMRTKDLIKMADSFKPNIFAGMAEYIANKFLPAAARNKVKLPKKALFVNGAEKMSDKNKEKIIRLAKKTGIKEPLVLDFYGASELKEDVMPECMPNSGFHHIAQLSNIIRTVKINKMPKGDKLITDWEFTKPEEGGAAIIWNINGAGTLLNGYLIGDKYEKIIKGRCPNCRIKTERIFGISRLKLK
ncbi:hypothetical protein KY346_01380 [Candidatus Woesearchaeota archaeon]|nr:hypothetical protein [Candidatus Woesearchaeota archaeon]